MKPIQIFAVAILCLIKLSYCVYDKDAGMVLIGYLLEEEIYVHPLETFDDDTAKKVDNHFMEHLFLDSYSKPDDAYLRELGVTTFFHILFEPATTSTILPSAIVQGKLVPNTKATSDGLDQLYFKKGDEEVTEQEAIYVVFNFLLDTKLNLKKYCNDVGQVALFYSPVTYKIGIRGKANQETKTFFQCGVAFKRVEAKKPVIQPDDNGSAKNTMQMSLALLPNVNLDMAENGVEVIDTSGTKEANAGKPIVHENSTEVSDTSSKDEMPVMVSDVNQKSNIRKSMEHEEGGNPSGQPTLDSKHGHIKQRNRDVKLEASEEAVEPELVNTIRSRETDNETKVDSVVPINAEKVNAQNQSEAEPEVVDTNVIENNKIQNQNSSNRAAENDENADDNPRIDSDLKLNTEQKDGNSHQRGAINLNKKLSEPLLSENAQNRGTESDLSYRETDKMANVPRKGGINEIDDENLVPALTSTQKTKSTRNGILKKSKQVRADDKQHQMEVDEDGQTKCGFPIFLKFRKSRTNISPKSVSKKGLSLNSNSQTVPAEVLLPNNDPHRTEASKKVSTLKMSVKKLFR